jgi:hypothetical protein
LAVFKTNWIHNIPLYTFGAKIFCQIEMARKIEDSFSQVLAVSRSSRKIRNIIAEVEDLTLKVE